MIALLLLPTITLSGGSIAVEVDPGMVLQESRDLVLWIDSTNTRPTQPVAFFRASSPSNHPPMKICVVGDSTSSDVNGWGQSIRSFLSPRATFLNLSAPSASSASFLRQSPELARLQAEQPDVVLIELGFGDTAFGTDRWTSIADYTENLRAIIAMVDDFCGVPVLVTPLPPRVWSGGHAVSYPEDRCNAMRALTAETGVRLIDLNAAALAIYEVSGGTTVFDFAPGDNVHLSKAGGDAIAEALVLRLPPFFGPYISRLP